MRALAWALACALMCAPPVSAVGHSSGVAVLVYHNFVSDEDAAKRPGLLDEMTMSRAQFRAQIELLRKDGATFLTVEQFVAHVKGGAPAPRHSVLVAIDDGYESVYRIAWPILREEKVPALVALIVGATDEPAAWAAHHPGAAAHLTWAECAEMTATLPEVGHPLVTLGSHTYDMHQNLAREERELGAAEREAFRARLLADLKKAREVVRARTGGQTAALLVWPHGGSSAALVEVARAAGHDGTFTDLGPVVRPGDDPMRMMRVHAGSGTRSRGALERNMRSAGW